MHASVPRRWASALAASMIVGCATSPPDGAGGSDADVSSDGTAGDAAVVLDATVADGMPSDATVDGADGGAPPSPAVQPIGVNLPFLLLGTLGITPGGPDAQLAALDDAKTLGLTHARFIASGFWPVDMTAGSGWLANPTAYWAAFDKVVAAAHAHQIRLVPSLLWNINLFPDIAGEPTGQLFVPGSKSRTMAEKYITEVVTRYATTDDILFWEMGNEFNLVADLDISTCTVCPGDTANDCTELNPGGGTPCRRTAADNIFSCNTCRGAAGAAQQDLGQFTAAIAKLVHAIDPLRPFSSGDSYPLPSAWHLGARPCPACDFTVDSQADYTNALAQLHPAGVDIISVHHYPTQDSLARFGSNDHTGREVLALTQSYAAGAGRKLFVGEYGELRAGTTTCNGTATTCGGEGTFGSSFWTESYLSELQVPYAEMWALDAFQTCANVPTCGTILPSDPIVASFATHNAAYKACVGKADGVACPIGTCAAGVCTPLPGADITFTAPSPPSGWTSWTNCAGCAPATFNVTSAAGKSYFEILTHDLPCTGGCTYPGAYSVAVAVPVSGAHGLARLVARATGSAVIDFIPFDAAGTELTHAAMPVPVGASFVSTAFRFDLPAGATTVRPRLELTAANALLDVQELVVVSEP